MLSCEGDARSLKTGNRELRDRSATQLILRNAMATYIPLLASKSCVAPSILESQDR